MTLAWSIVNSNLMPKPDTSPVAVSVSCAVYLGHFITSPLPPLPPIDTIWAMMIVWRTRGDYRTARAVLEAIIAFSAMHTYAHTAAPRGQTDLPLSHWVHFTVLRCICVFVFSCISLHACCIIVTRWGGPGGIEAWSDWPSSFSALTLLVGSHDL